MKKNQGITLMSLIVTIIILLILAGVSIRSLTGSKGLINQAKETKTAAEMKEIEEQIELVLVKAELKSNNVTMESVIKQLINAGLIDDESQVDQDTGDITFGDYVLEEKLADYVITPEEKYYGNKNTVVTNPTYFTFTVDEAAGTATITGVKDEYAVKTYYNGEATNYTAVIKDGENYVTDVVIPYEYVDENGKKYVVTGIGASAFSIKAGENWDAGLSNVDKKFTSFVLPNTITSIGNKAFLGCADLSSINIPRGVTSIGGSAFYGCTSLSSINIPTSVTNIGGLAFYKCSSLGSIIIPNGVTKIADYTFDYCTNLTSIRIPDSVTSIGYSAIEGCSSLSSIKLPTSLISLGSYAFHNCTSLASIEIPSSVTKIGSNAFLGCTNLSSVNIPRGITSIENGVFWGCSSLKNIEIPNSVTNIGMRAFAGCSSLSQINIPESVKSIGNAAFNKCRNLNSIDIPRSVTTIGTLAFEYWISTQTINCEILEADKPSGWNAKWDYYDGSTARKATINWGVSM